MVKSMDKEQVEKIPRYMRQKEWCMICGKEMAIYSAFVVEAGDRVEVWYRCACGYRIGFTFDGAFVAAFKKAKGLEPQVDGVPVQFGNWNEKQE